MYDEERRGASDHLAPQCCHPYLLVPHRRRSPLRDSHFTVMWRSPDSHV